MIKYTFGFDAYGMNVDKTLIVKFDDGFTPPVSTYFRENDQREWSLYQAWLAEGNETEYPYGHAPQ